MEKINNWYFKNKRSVVIIALLLFLTMFSILVSPGYKTLKSDQQIYIPQMQEAMEGDLLFSFKQTGFTIFDELLPEDGLFFVLFVLTVLFRFVFFYSVFLLAKYFIKDDYFSLLCTGFFLVPLVVYGTRVLVLTSELIPRDIGLSLCLLYLVLYLNGYRFWCLLPLSFAFLFHPITVIPFFIFYYIRLLFFDKNTKIRFLLFFVFPLLLSLVFLPGLEGASFGVIDSEWEGVIRDRDGYVFLSSWDWYVWPYLLVSFVSLLFLLYNLEGKDWNVWLLFFIPLFLFCASFVLVDFLKLSFFASLLLPRALVLWLVLLPILFVHYAGLFFKRRFSESFLIKCLFFVVLFLVAIMILFSPSLSVSPDYESDDGLVELCAWVNGNTRVDDLFGVESSSMAVFVRVCADRGVYFSYKDGALVVFDRDFAMEWSRRRGVVESGLIPDLVDYVILQREDFVGGFLVFTGGGYFVYSV